MEYNKVIRHYHGHLSGVYSLALHPTLDVLITGGRDSVARVCFLLNNCTYHSYNICEYIFNIYLFPLIIVNQVWDIRTKNQIHVLGGHSNTVGTLITNSVDPQVITGSHDSTIKVEKIHEIPIVV